MVHNRRSKSHQKRQKVYLQKIWYIKNFLNLLKFYRAYLTWKHIKRMKRAIKWHTYNAICWKTFTLRWNPQLYYNNNNFYDDAIVIYRFFGCKLTFNVIDGFFLLMNDELIIDKIFVIFFTHETVWSYCLHSLLSLLRARQCKI